MSEYVTGQIYGWNGGECPVHPESVVNIWLRDGGCNNQRPAIGLDWLHGMVDDGLDIVCFQVVTPYAEPKVIYVNEYGDGRGFGYTSEEVAKSAETKYHTRIAVKYVEVKK